MQTDMIVKINNSKIIYNGFYGRIKSIPLGMLARKDKDIQEDRNHLFEKKKSVIETSLQGDCEERHLEDLIGYVDVKVTFGPDMSIMDQPILITIPVCKLIPLSAREQIPFETILAKNLHIKNVSFKNKIHDFLQEILRLKEYTHDDNKINQISIEETRVYLNKFEELDLCHEFGIQNLEEVEDEESLEVK